MTAIAGPLLWATINGVTYGATLFLVAVGLSLIFGVLRVLNVAHGSFYALGAFTAASAWLLISALGWPPLCIYPALVISALVVGVAVGPVVERGLLRWTFGIEAEAARENAQLLATYAIFLMLEDAQKLIWGGQPYYSGSALRLLGITRINGIPYTNYQLLLILVAVLVLIALRILLRGTKMGKFVLAVAEDPEVSSAMGIPVARIYTVAFTVGAILAALGGALASPTIGVNTGIGSEMIVLSFAVVAIAGLGQIEGAAVAALVIGVGHSIAVFFFPALSSVIPYATMLLVLVFKPYGLFAAAQVRRI